jgi:hypothetical protein
MQVFGCCCIDCSLFNYLKEILYLITVPYSYLAQRETILVGMAHF